MGFMEIGLILIWYILPMLLCFLLSYLIFLGKGEDKVDRSISVLGIGLIPFFNMMVLAHWDDIKGE